MFLRVLCGFYLALALALWPLFPQCPLWSILVVARPGCTTKCFEILFFLANSPGQRWSAILFPMTRFPDDPIFQITRSPDLSRLAVWITGSPDLKLWLWLRYVVSFVVKGFPRCARDELRFDFRAT